MSTPSVGSSNDVVEGAWEDVDPVASPATVLPSAPAAQAPAAQAATLQTQERAALVAVRDWNKLGPRVSASGYDRSLSEPALRMLATAGRREARLLAAEQPDLPDDLLPQLCTDRSHQVVEQAQHQRWLRGLFTELPGHPDEEVLHPRCPADVLLLHVRNGRYWAQNRALQHSNLAMAERERLARTGSPTALLALGSNPAMTPAEYQALTAGLPPEAAEQLRLGYLSNPNGDPTVLRGAVGGRRRPAPPVLRALAGNPGAPADVLRAVWGPSTRPDELVRNRACPPDVLAAICSVHPNANRVQSWALLHPNADDAVRAAVRVSMLTRDTVLTALGRDCTVQAQVTVAAQLATHWHEPYRLLLDISAGLAA